MLEFRTLASALTPCAIEDAPDALQQRQPDEPATFVSDDVELAIREARLFRAHVKEAVDAALSSLLADIAAELLARELRLAPVDVSAIVTAAMQRYEFEMPLRVRVHPQDAQALARVDLPVVADRGLRRGDVFLELREGAIDLRLGVGLEQVLSARST